MHLQLAEGFDHLTQREGVEREKTRYKVLSVKRLITSVTRWLTFGDEITNLGDEMTFLVTWWLSPPKKEEIRLHFYFKRRQDVPGGSSDRGGGRQLPPWLRRSVSHNKRYLKRSDYWPGYRVPNKIFVLILPAVAHAKFRTKRNFPYSGGTCGPAVTLTSSRVFAVWSPSLCVVTSCRN